MLRVPAVERGRTVSGQPLEAKQVEPVRLDPDPVPGRLRLDAGFGPEESPELGDLTLHLRHRSDRRTPRIHVVGDALHRDDAVRVQEEDRQRRALLRTSECEGSSVADDLERPEDRKLEHRLTVAAR